MKYLSMIFLLKDVSASYKEAKGEAKPWYLSRRVIGSLIAVAGAGAYAFLGVNIDDVTLSGITEHVRNLITAAVTLYGVVMAIVGKLKKAKTNG